MAILTLGLGIAVNTTVFSWVDSVLLRPIPGAADADRLLIIWSPSLGAAPIIVQAGPAVKAGFDIPAGADLPWRASSPAEGGSHA